MMHRLVRKRRPGEGHIDDCTRARQHERADASADPAVRQRRTRR